MDNDWINLLAELPPQALNYENLSIDCELFLKSGKIVEGFIRDDGKTIQAYMLHNHAYRRCDAIAWRYLPEEVA